MGWNKLEKARFTGFYKRRLLNVGRPLFKALEDPKKAQRQLGAKRYPGVDSTAQIQ